MANDLVNYEDAWGEEAKASTAVERRVSGGRSISHKAGLFRIGDDLEFPELCIIIMGAAFENTYYDTAYSPDRVEPPKCFAIGEREDQMAPHDATQDSDYFRPQADTCALCEHNKFPKAGEVKRKACRNGRRLIVLPAGMYKKRPRSRDLDLEMFLGENQDDNREYIQSGDLFSLKVPPSSLRAYKDVVHQMREQHGRPPHGMVVRAFTEPLRNGGHGLYFEALGKVPDYLHPEVTARRKADVADMLLRPYSEPRDDADDA